MPYRVAHHKLLLGGATATPIQDGQRHEQHQCNLDSEEDGRLGTPEDESHWAAQRTKRRKQPIEAVYEFRMRQHTVGQEAEDANQHEQHAHWVSLVGEVSHRHTPIQQRRQCNHVRELNVQVKVAIHQQFYVFDGARTD